MSNTLLDYKKGLKYENIISDLENIDHQLSNALSTVFQNIRVFRGPRLSLANLDLGEDSLAEAEAKTRSRFLESSEPEVKARPRLRNIFEAIASVSEASLGFNHNKKI